jgi:hypothetical protein
MVVLIHFDASPNIIFFSLAFMSVLHVKQKKLFVVIHTCFCHASYLTKNHLGMLLPLKNKNGEKSHC